MTRPFIPARGTTAAPIFRTHFDGPTGQWLAWVDPWRPESPLGKGATEIAAKEDLAAQLKDAAK